MIYLMLLLTFVVFIISLIIQWKSCNYWLKVFSWMLCAIIAIIAFILTVIQIYDILICYIFQEVFCHKYVLDLFFK